MKFQIDPNLLRKEDEVSIYGSNFGLPVGAGNAVSRENMLLFFPGLKDLDFRVTPVGDTHVQIWVNKDEYLAFEKKMHENLSKEQESALLSALPGFAIKSLIQAFFSSATIAGIMWIINSVFETEINISSVFAWSFAVIFLISFLFLSMFTDTSKLR